MKKGSSGATATYVYCLVRSAKTPRLVRVPRGLPGAGAPRPIDCRRGLWLIVGTAPLELYGEAQIAAGLKDLDWVGACALAHQRVVSHFRSARAVAPMKLFTLFASDERAAHYVDRSRRTLERALEAVAGCDEWGVRLAMEKGAAPAAAKRAPRSESGTGFLVAKREAHAARRGLGERTRAEAERIFEALSKVAKDAHKRPILTNGAVASRLVVDAVFLVPAGRARRFASAAQKLAREGLREGLGVEVTGPWPPYGFVGGSR